MESATRIRLPTLLHGARGRVFILVHGTDAPHMEDWKVYLVALVEAAKKHRDLALVVIGEGKGPSPVQIDMLDKVAPKPLPTAVVTASALARGVVTLISWFHKDIKAFAPTDIDAAFGYLTVPAVERPGVLSAIASMRAQLSGAAGATGDAEATAMLKETAIEPMEAVVTRLATLRSEIATRRRSG